MRAGVYSLLIFLLFLPSLENARAQGSSRAAIESIFAKKPRLRGSGVADDIARRLELESSQVIDRLKDTPPVYGVRYGNDKEVKALLSRSRVDDGQTIEARFERTYSNASLHSPDSVQRAVEAMILVENMRQARAILRRNQAVFSLLERVPPGRSGRDMAIESQFDLESFSERKSIRVYSTHHARTKVVEFTRYWRTDGRRLVVFGSFAGGVFFSHSIDGKELAESVSQESGPRSRSNCYGMNVHPCPIGRAEFLHRLCQTQGEAEGAVIYQPGFCARYKETP